jgi:autotransporter translocation and assembly factor TamB
VLALASYLLLSDYTETLRAALEKQLGEVSGGAAKITSISLDLPHYAFELRGVSVGGPAGGAPVLELERVRGRLRPFELLNLRLTWSELLLSGLTLRLAEDREGLHLPREAPAGPLAAFAVSADRISVERGVLVIRNERVPWDLEAQELSLRLERLGSELYQGKLAYEGGRIRIKDHQEIRASVTADLEIVSQEIFVREARAQTDVGWISMTGKLGFAGGERGRFALTAEGESGPAAQSLFGMAGAAAWLEGIASFRGTLSVEPGTKSLEGTLSLPRGRLSGIDYSDWKGEVFWDRSLLQISYAQGRFAGGAARMQLHQPLPSAEHPAALELDLDRGSLAAVIAAARGLPGPIESTVSGRGSFTFSARPPTLLNGRFELDGAYPTATALTPLSFHARGEVGDGDLEIEELRVETSFLQGSISGVYPRRGPAQLHVELASTDLVAAERLKRELGSIAGFEGASDFQLAGRGRIAGELGSRLPSLTFEGGVSAQELSVQSVRLGEIEARASLIGSELRLEGVEARLEGGSLSGGAALSLAGTSLDRSLALDVKLAGWPVEDLARFLDSPVELRGRLSGKAALRREASPIEGDAELTLDEGILAGFPLDSGKLRVEISGTRVRIEPLTLARGPVRISGRVELDRETAALRGSVSLEEVPLSQSSGEAVRLRPLEGSLSAAIELSGRLDEPIAAISGRGEALRILGTDLGAATLSGRLRGNTLDLHVGAGRVSAEATLSLEGDFPARGRLQWTDLDWGPWIGLGATTSVLTGGEATFRLDARASDFLASAEVDASLKKLVVSNPSFRSEANAPVSLRVRAGRLDISRIELAQAETALTLGGSVDLVRDVLALDAEGLASLGLLESFYPGLGLDASGEASLSARISGSREQPEIVGHADLDGGSLRLAGFRQALGGLRGRVVFDNRTIRVSELRGVFGSGPVSISGSVGLDGLLPGSVDLTLRGSGVRLRYPEGLVATLEGELSLLGSRDERMLSGALTLTDATWSREYDLVSGILSDREGRSFFGDFPGKEGLAGLRLNVDIRAPSSLRIHNSLATLEASADLELRGTVGEPVLLGRSEARRGEIHFLGQRYNITSGKVDFVDPSRIEPFVDLTAETRVRSYRVELRLTGTPERFFPELTSDPPLRTVDILRLLAGANERDILIGNEEEELAGVATATLLTERLTQEVGRRAERLFGLDRFSIDPFLVGQFANPTARVSLGKQITRQLSINYSTNLNDTTEAIILIEYTPDGPMSWILSRDEDGDVGIDVKFRKSF